MAPPSRVNRTDVTWLECPPYVRPLPPNAGARYRLTMPRSSPVATT
eukprot:CAMPEP_0181387968 /NCGR_PEP_ID=MMETSP1106-20121128/24032_1 /TAXON_ID=81844 /ORGANISM="Mantoniella antarctica, Strain SL-175" /LENGTH=45 /DNA_ID= /DNA_START= /DNA_END= /DNA_ORIENTATION=